MNFVTGRARSIYYASAPCKYVEKWLNLFVRWCAISTRWPTWVWGMCKGPYEWVVRKPLSHLRTLVMSSGPRHCKYLWLELGEPSVHPIHIVSYTCHPFPYFLHKILTIHWIWSTVASHRGRECILNLTDSCKWKEIGWMPWIILFSDVRWYSKVHDDGYVIWHDKIL